jgi:hypothetical protein
MAMADRLPGDAADPRSAAMPGRRPESAAVPGSEGTRPAASGAALTAAELAALAAADFDPADDDRDLDPEGPPEGGADGFAATLPEEERAAFWAGLNEVAETRAGEPSPELLGSGCTPSGRGTGFAAGGALDRMPPGAELAWHAEAFWDRGLDQLSDDELVGLLGGWRRLASRATAAEAACISELGRRRAAQAEARNPGRRAGMGPLVSEVAAALTLSGVAAGRLVMLAEALARLRPVAVALAAGRIDERRAAVFADELDCVPDIVTASAIAAAMIGDAGRMTAPRLRQALRRMVLSVAPEAAARRREQAARQARVECYPEASGNAVLAGRELPPEEAAAADQRVDRLAQWLKDHGAERPLAELRAQVYLCLLTGGDPAGLLPGADGPAAAAAPAPAGPAPAGPASGLRGCVTVTIPLSTWLGRDLAPGEIGGFGAADGSACRELAARLAADRRNRWCVTITGAAGQAVGHACARAGPGPPGTPGGTDAWLSRLTVNWFERGGCSHRRERPGYRIAPALAHLIKIRHRTCCFPGCRRAARRCDLDHTIPYHSGGRSCECNLAPLCRTHHQCKQEPGWRLRQPEPGRMIWTTPSGRRYTADPEPYPA